MADKRAERIAELIKPLRVKPGSKVNLARDFDPGYKADFVKKKDGRQLLETGIALLADYQRRLAAQDTYGVLVCLQALDAGGKDGTIRHVMSGVNPQGVQVSGFKVPSAEELDHDYLWRYACRLPARGDIGIFNRSHYEEVLVVRVHPENLDRQKLPAGAKGKGVWERRYREINDWERYLTDNGFKVVKLFLNLSKEEQRTRFFKRLDLPEKNWKFSAADVRERQRWDDYQQAFSQMLSATSTALGAVVCDPGGPQVVRADLRGRGARAHPDRDRSAVPGGDRGPAGGPAGGQGRTGGPGAQGRPRRPVRRQESQGRSQARPGRPRRPRQRRRQRRGRQKPARRPKPRPARLPGTGTGLRRAGISRPGRAAPGAGRAARTGRHRRPRGPAGPAAAPPLRASQLS